jgi:hypothetical protein
MCRVCGVTWQGAIVCLHEYNKRFASSSMGWFTDASVNMCMHERIAACLLPGWIDIRITRFRSTCYTIGYCLRPVHEAIRDCITSGIFNRIEQS